MLSEKYMGTLVIAVHFLALFRSNLQCENGRQSPVYTCTFAILTLHRFKTCTHFLSGIFVLAYFWFKNSVRVKRRLEDELLPRRLFQGRSADGRPIHRPEWPAVIRSLPRSRRSICCVSQSLHVELFLGSKVHYVFCIEI